MTISMMNGCSAQGLQLEEISHRFGDHRVLDRVTLSVAPGEVLCMLGPSGCGKTTLLRLAAGLEEVQSGRVVLNGRTVASPERSEPPEHRGVGFVFQDFALFPHLSLADNVAFGLGGRIPAAERRARVQTMLETVGMGSRADAFPHMLSGGQQQRVALARALAPRPGLILLDEPFSGLDARLREQLRDETLHVLKGSRVMTLMVTHDPEEAMFMADRIAVMQGGRVVQSDTPFNLYFHPATPFVARFFGEVNRLTAVAQGGAAHTLFGPLAAAADGPALVMIRPEALSLVPQPQSQVSGMVVDAHLLGRHAMVTVAVEIPTGLCDLTASVPGNALPRVGERVHLRLDPSLAFVFTAQGEERGDLVYADPG